MSRRAMRIDVIRLRSAVAAYRAYLTTIVVVATRFDCSSPPFLLHVGTHVERFGSRRAHFAAVDRYSAKFRCVVGRFEHV
jgi:hypothetical protein